MITTITMAIMITTHHTVIINGHHKAKLTVLELEHRARGARFKLDQLTGETVQ